MSARENENELELRRERWHVGKEIPIAVMLTLVVQTVGLGWWAGKVSEKLDSVIAQVTELRAERYTKDDARRDKELMQQRFADVERRVNALEVRR